MTQLPLLTLPSARQLMLCVNAFGGRNFVKMLSCIADTV
jgi:hypothetical protein